MNLIELRGSATGLLGRYRKLLEKLSSCGPRRGGYRPRPGHVQDIMRNPSINIYDNYHLNYIAFEHVVKAQGWVAA